MISAGVAPERFLYLQEAFAASSALVAAREVGIVDCLDVGPVFPGTVARDGTIGERDARLLLSALARRDPTCRVTAVDLPDVLERTRQAVTDAGHNGQFELLAGDFFTADWVESAYDLAIAGNICHLFDEAANRRLLKRLFTAIRKGGRLAILDSIPNEQLDGPRPVVLYSLSMLLRTSHGQAYPFSAYQAWLRKAGYHQIERLDWPDSQVSLVNAHRTGPQKLPSMP